MASKRRIAGCTRASYYTYMSEKCNEKYKEIYGENIKGIFNRVNCEIWLDTFIEFLQEQIDRLEVDTSFIFEGLKIWRNSPKVMKYHNIKTGEINSAVSKMNYKIKFLNKFFEKKEGWKKYTRRDMPLTNFISRKKYEEAEEQIAAEIENGWGMTL